MSVFRRRQDLVPARNVEAYRSAAASVLLRTYEQADRIRADLGQIHPWQAAELVRLQLLSLWAVQTCFVAADQVLTAVRRDRVPDGELSAPVALRLESLYRLGNGWVPWLEQALAGEDTVRGVALPLRLTVPTGPAVPTAAGGVQSREVTADEVQAGVALADALAAQVEQVWNEMECGYQLPREFRPWVTQLRQRYTGIRVGVDQQRELWLGRPEGPLRRELSGRLELLGEELFRLGQGMIVPRLFDAGFTLRADRASPGVELRPPSGACSPRCGYGSGSTPGC